MIKYFENYPTITYPFNGFTGISQSAELESVDMTVRFKILDEVMKNSSSYYEYVWQETDRLDTLADKYYSDANLSWVVMMSGQIFDWIYDLPLSRDLFEQYICEKYNVETPYALKHLSHHYEDYDGARIDKETFDLYDPSLRRSVSLYDYEFNKNEAKRVIKLVSRTLINQILNEFDTKLQNIKNTRRLANYEK